MSTQQPALTMENLTLEYPDGSDNVLTALDSVSLTVDRGEMLSLVGPSGSGKSSLISVAAGLIEPTRGAVRVDGDSVTDMSQRQRAELRRDSLGIIFQQPNLLASLTAVEQLVLVADLRGGLTPEGPTACPRSLGGGRPGEVCGPTAAPALRRPAAAGEHRPGADGLTGGAAGR